MDQKIPYAIGLVVLVLLLFVFTLSHANAAIYEDTIQGMWAADPDWAERAGIDGMLLYIGKNESSFSDVRKGYMILHAGNQVIASKQIEFNLGVRLMPWPSSTITKNITIKDLDVEDEMPDANDIPLSDIMPSNLTMVLTVGGTLRLTGQELDGDNSDGEPVEYARLYKDALATEIDRTRDENDIE